MTADTTTSANDAQLGEGSPGQRPPRRAVARRAEPARVPADLSVARLNVMRAGFLFMAGGLMAVKWPLLPDAQSLPLYEGVVACLLTAMSLLALLGLRYPLAMLPVLVFEVTWKLLWLGLVALPSALHDDVDADMRQLIINCSFVVLIIAVTPWRYAWRRYTTAPADPWRTRNTG